MADKGPENKELSDEELGKDSFLFDESPEYVKKLDDCKAFLKEVGMVENYPRFELFDTKLKNKIVDGLIDSHTHFLADEIPENYRIRNRVTDIKSYVPPRELSTKKHFHIYLDVDTKKITDMEPYDVKILLKISEIAKKHGIDLGHHDDYKIMEILGDERCKSCKREQCSSYTDNEGEHQFICDHYETVLPGHSK